MLEAKKRRTADAPPLINRLRRKEGALSAATLNYCYLQLSDFELPILVKGTPGHVRFFLRLAGDHRGQPEPCKCIQRSISLEIMSVIQPTFMLPT